MRDIGLQRLGLGLLIGGVCVLSACAAEQVAPTPAPVARIGLGCEFFGCPSNFVAVPGLRATARSVVAGGSGVWALDDRSAIYHFNENTKQFDQVPGSLAWISVGGGNYVIDDEVWGGTPDHHIFTWAFWANRWQEQANPPGDPIQYVVAGGGHNSDGCHFHEVWGISVANHVYRLRYCLPGGWELIQSPSLVTLAAGGGEVWGLDAANQVYRFDTGTKSFQQIPGRLTRLAVGVDGVWGVLDTTLVNTGSAVAARVGGVGGLFTPQVFQYNAATQTLVQIPNAEMKDIAAGGNGVWALDEAQHVFRLQALSRKFVPVPNVALRSVTVGSGTDVWGIDQNHQIRAFVTPARLTGGSNAPPAAMQ